MVLKSWEASGRQVGQLWMLTASQLKQLSIDAGLKDQLPKSEGSEDEDDSGAYKSALIAVLAKHLRSKKVLLLTDGSTKTDEGSAAGYGTSYYCSPFLVFCGSRIQK